MTDRRSFFKSLMLLGAAAAGCPGIFIPKFEPVKWKVISSTNPVWSERDYVGEWSFIMDSVVTHPVIRDSSRRLLQVL